MLGILDKGCLSAHNMGKIQTSESILYEIMLFLKFPPNRSVANYNDKHTIIIIGVIV